MHIQDLIFNNRYYRSIKEIPLYNFIEIIETNDLKFLMKHGPGRRKKKIQIWEKIFDEYITLTNDKKVNNVFLLARFVTFERFKISLLMILLNSIRKQWNTELAEKINSLGIRSRITEDTFHRDIIRINGEIKLMVLSLRKKEKELKDKNKGEQSGRNEWVKLLMDLSKYQGYRINPKKITVYEFCIILLNYKDEAQQIKKNNKKWHQV